LEGNVLEIGDNVKLNLDNLNENYLSP